jgi:hypothetical protein
VFDRYHWYWHGRKLLILEPSRKADDTHGLPVRAIFFSGRVPGERRLGEFAVDVRGRVGGILRVLRMAVARHHHHHLGKTCARMSSTWVVGEIWA